jgi:hypothetical protein
LASDSRAALNAVAVAACTTVTPMPQQTLHGRLRTLRGMLDGAAIQAHHLGLKEARDLILDADVALSDAIAQVEERDRLASSAEHRAAADESPGAA